MSLPKPENNCPHLNFEEYWIGTEVHSFSCLDCGKEFRDDLSALPIVREEMMSESVERKRIQELAWDEGFKAGAIHAKKIAEIGITIETLNKLPAPPKNPYREGND